MTPHLRYLKYVLLHKWYVYHAGMLLAKLRGEYRWRLFWRLLFHDFSKLSRAEWGPYVRQFYGEPSDVEARRQLMRLPPEQQLDVTFDRLRLAELKARGYAFNVAWLHHQHVNDHHWQHWLLREDSGANIQLLPPAWAIDEMVADWCGAGSKILQLPHLAVCIRETVDWYIQQYAVIQLRTQARERVEESLYFLAAHFGEHAAMERILDCKERRVTSRIELRPAVQR